LSRKTRILNPVMTYQSLIHPRLKRRGSLEICYSIAEMYIYCHVLSVKSVMTNNDVLICLK